MASPARRCGTRRVGSREWDGKTACRGDACESIARAPTSFLCELPPVVKPG